MWTYTMELSLIDYLICGPCVAAALVCLVLASCCSMGKLMELTISGSF